MRYLKLFGKTVREAPSDATMDSYKLLYQAGYIRESTAGRVFFFGGGIEKKQKKIKIIKEVNVCCGAQEII